MIQGNQTWQSALNVPQKQPLYVLRIPQFGIVLATFTESQLTAPTQSGYGVGLYGIQPYGS